MAAATALSNVSFYIAIRPKVLFQNEKNTFDKIGKRKNGDNQEKAAATALSNVAFYIAIQPKVLFQNEKNTFDKI